MIRLNGFLVVLEDNFSEVMKREVKDRSAKNNWTRWRIVLDFVQLKHSRNVVKISNLQWSVWVYVRDLIYSITPLSIDFASRICQHKCPRHWYCPVMECSLWIRPRSICCQVPSSQQDQKKYVRRNNTGRGRARNSSTGIQQNIKMSYLGCEPVLSYVKGIK